MLKKYMEQNKKVGVFGVSYLDYKLRGILQGDLIIIGSRSGAGKSTIAEQIAKANKANKPSLFSLEDFEGDSFIKAAYYKYIQETKDYVLSLRDFASGDFQADMFALHRAEEHAKATFEGVNIINRKRDFGIVELKEGIIKEVEENNAKLIIIDHLDYVSKYSNESDIQHINDLMRTIRNVQDSFKVAVVAISHLRKSPHVKDAPIIPSMEEFIGSSNKVKEATVVVMLAPDDEGNMETTDKTKRLTWCCIRKLRMGGIDNTAAKIVFDTNTGQYIEQFHLYRVNYSGTQVEKI